MSVTMTNNKELHALVTRACDAGANVLVTYDHAARISEGRKIIATVQVQGVKGIGPYPMPAIRAAERLRDVFGAPDMPDRAEHADTDKLARSATLPDINPFTDSLGMIYALSFVAVAVSAWQTGMRHVFGMLPLWAIVAALLAAGCVLMHWAKWNEPVFACPLAVTWAFLALILVIADTVNRIDPATAEMTPLADPMVLQWATVACTVGFGAAAVFSHFKMILNNYNYQSDAGALVAPASTVPLIDIHAARSEL
jgi:hypothetical protein